MRRSVGTADRANPCAIFQSESQILKNYLFIDTFELLTFLGYINIFTLMQTSLYRYPAQKTFELSPFVKNFGRHSFAFAALLGRPATRSIADAKGGCGVWAKPKINKTLAKM